MPQGCPFPRQCRSGAAKCPPGKYWTDRMSSSSRCRDGLQQGRLPGNPLVIQNHHNVDFHRENIVVDPGVSVIPFYRLPSRTGVVPHVPRDLPHQNHIDQTNDIRSNQFLWESLEKQLHRQKPVLQNWRHRRPAPIHPYQTLERRYAPYRLYNNHLLPRDQSCSLLGLCQEDQDQSGNRNRGCRSGHHEPGGFDLWSCFYPGRLDCSWKIRCLYRLLLNNNTRKPPYQNRWDR